MHLIHRGILNKNYKENNLKSFKSSFKKGYGLKQIFMQQKIMNLFVFMILL